MESLIESGDDVAFRLPEDSPKFILSIVIHFDNHNRAVRLEFGINCRVFTIFGILGGVLLITSTYLPGRISKKLTNRRQSRQLLHGVNAPRKASDNNIYFYTATSQPIYYSSPPSSYHCYQYTTTPRIIDRSHSPIPHRYSKTSAFPTNQEDSDVRIFLLFPRIAIQFQCERRKQHDLSRSANG